MNDQKKVKVLESAKELFFLYGVKKTTVDEIAKRAGVGKGTIYLYFSSKEDILSELAKNELNTIAAAIESTIDRDSSSTDQLTHFLKSFIMNSYDFIKSNVHASDIFMAMNLEDNSSSEEQCSNDFAIIVSIAYGILEGGKETSQFYHNNTIEMIGNIFFVLQCCLPPQSSFLERTTLDEKSDYLINLIVKGLEEE